MPLRVGDQQVANLGPGDRDATIAGVRTNDLTISPGALFGGEQARQILGVEQNQVTPAAQ